MSVMRKLVPLLLLLVFLPVALPVAAQGADDGTVQIEAQAAFGGAYRVGSWFPVLVTVENSGADYSGEVRVGVPRGASFYAARVDLPRGARKAVTVYTRVDNPARRLEISFVANGTALASTQLRLSPNLPNDLLTGVLVPEPAALQLPGRRSSDNTRVFLVELSPGELPEQTPGLQSFSTLVIDDFASASLSDGQREALVGWVAQGGRLVLGAGNLQASLAGLPAELRPVEAGEAGQSAEAAALGIYASVSPPAGPLPIVEVQPRAGSFVVVGETQPLIVERSVGRGQVVLLAMPLNSPALVGWVEAPAFWDRLLRPIAGQVLTGAWAPGVTDVDEFRVQSVASNLTNLPSLDLPSLGLLASLILAYILLVGPLAYLILRRLDRQALGWIVVPMLTLLFSAAAYGVGFSLRGGDILLNQINVVEPLLGDQMRVRSFVGIFSPDSRSYELRIEGQPMVRPVSLYGPWGGPEAPREDGVFLQSGVQNLTINQWSMRGLMAESIQTLGTVEAQVVYSGGRFEGEVVNNTASTLRGAVLVRGDEIVHLGDIAPGERRSGRLVRPQGADPGMSVGYLIYKDELTATNNQPPDRETQRRQSIIDSFYSNGPFLRGSSPLLIGWLDATPHQVELPASRVDTRHLTLFTTVPRLSFSDSNLSLERGWIDLQAFDLNGQPSTCFTPKGQGFATYNGDVEASLRLPRELRGLQVAALSLNLGSDGPWPQKATIEIYDLETSSWTALEVSGPGTVEIAERQRFFSPEGELRLRFANNGVPAGNCILADLSLKGTLQ